MEIDLEGKDIAVVGSSGNLLRNTYGADIDNHDIIIRFNQARVQGYENHVGSRTDIRIVNTHVLKGTTGSAGFSKLDKKFIQKLTPQLVIVSRPVLFDKRTISPNNDVLVFNGELYNYCKQTLNNSKDPSVGFLGVFLALTSKKKVSVYGFDQANTTKNKHYWEEVSKIGQHHKFSREKEIFEELEKQELITIFR